ncbi:MAG: carboxylesterase/lipase family protein [Eubacteriales bacterium]|jgi:para-nitrobenzyl esterase
MMARKFVCTYDAPIVETKQGKLRGFQLDSTYIFRGIKYADAKRWEMPTPVEPWEGVKDALNYGYVCPLTADEKPSSGEIAVPHRYWPASEHCQYLNVWTQSIEKDAKKPVMVWLHGGGFAAGSSIEQVAYDGEALSVYGDVVVVTLNHRLNILGYFDVSSLGEQYWNSVNVGNADLVAALQWVNENIENFGGDPGNVTIFGQSGGGMKVTSLCQTPAADGLFQKGIVMSGTTDRDMFEMDMPDIVPTLMEKLNVKTGEELAAVPYKELVDAYFEIVGPGGRMAFGPKPNSWYMGEALSAGFSERQKKTSLMVGTVLGEFLAFGPGPKNRRNATDEEIREAVGKFYGAEHADEIIDAFKEAYPGKNPLDANVIDSIFRPAVKKYVKAKAQFTEAPTYSYIFTAEMPLDDGKAPWHCADIPFAFYNMDIVEYCNFPGADELQEQYASAFVNFARTGDPNGPGLPEWPAVTPDNEPCMIFDIESSVRNNHDDKLLELCRKYAPDFNLFGSDIEIEH